MMMKRLFVYGTLMRPFQSSMTRFLEKHSSFAGEGRVRGRLYDLGKYPGLILDTHAESVVTGHVFLLNNEQLVLQVLDEYEGINPVQPEVSEYRREWIPVATPTGALECWAYLYNRETGQLPCISSGNYVDYVKLHPEHQKFINSV